MLTVEALNYAIYEIATGRVSRLGRSSNARVLEVERAGMRPGFALYEGQIDPTTTYLPGGVPTPLAPVATTVPASEVKAWAGRLLSYTDWYITRHAETGDAIPAAVLSYRQAVRDASGAIEALDPIPADFRNSDLWPVAP